MPRREVDEWFWTVNDLQRLQGELLRSRPTVATGNCWEPRVDVYEEPHRVVIKAEIAGVRGEDIQLIYLEERHSIVIRGFRNDDGPNEGKRFHHMEIPSGEFAREVKLPDVPTDVQSMRAQYRNGFLIVMIPKAETIVVTHTITLQGR